MQSELLVSFRLVIDYTRRLVADIPPQKFVAQPAGVTNHPAWILGHLVHSLEAIGGEIGVAAWLSDDWPSCFGTGSTPSDDLDKYPPKATLLATFDDAVNRITKAIENLSPGDFSAPLPDEEYRKTLPTIGHALIHILVGHASVHVGQLTTWRNAMQLSHVREQFDRS
jgi:hypothetical protein